MPMQWVPPEVALEYKGVTIYHVYKNDDMEQGARTFWFGTSPDCSDENEKSFDIRALSTWVAACKAGSEKWMSMSDEERVMVTLKAAIDQKLLKNN